MALPPPPINQDPKSYAYQDYQRQLQDYVTSTSGSIPWASVSKTGSNITDLASRTHANLQSIQGGTAGEYYHLTSAQHSSIWTLVKKSTDESRTSNNTLTNDSALTFSMLANTKYHVRGKIYFDTAATPDFKWAITGPSSPTLVRLFHDEIIAGATSFSEIGVDTSFGTTHTAVGGGSTGGFIDIDAIVHNGANAGSFTFQWAQDTSDAAATKVLAGSMFEYITI